MAKKDDPKPNDPGKPNDPDPKDDKKKEFKTKVDDKIKAAEGKVHEKTGKRINLIGELADPGIETQDDFEEWSKVFDEKTDKLIAQIEEKQKTNTPPAPPKKKWYDRDLFAIFSE